MKKILIATEKPFAAKAVEGIKNIAEKNAYSLEILEKYGSKDKLLNAVADVDALIIRSDKIDSEVIDAAKELKIVVRAGAGYDNVDLEAAKAANIVVMNTPGQNSNAVAELAFGMMVMMARNGFNGKPGTELKGKNIGIHAYGNVGQCVGRIAKGFGMNVAIFDPFVNKAIVERDQVKVYENVEELYKSCQYISLHIPANDKTKKSIGFDLLSKMPEDAVLVNTARKEVIDEDGVIKLMEQRNDFKYISDIAPDLKDDFAKFEGRYFFTPKKMGAQTAEANINAGIAAVNQIINFIEKGDTTYQVNK